MSDHSYYRILIGVELVQEGILRHSVFGIRRPDGDYDIFATEGSFGGEWVGKVLPEDRIGVFPLGVTRTPMSPKEIAKLRMEGKL